MPDTQTPPVSPLSDASKRPVVVIDTGTLLTLLLGGERYEKGLGYASLLIDMVEKGIVDLVIPDMVLCEFMGALGPLYEEDLDPDNGYVSKVHGRVAWYNLKKMPAQFAKGQERFDLIHKLLKINDNQGRKAVTIRKTAAGDEYLQRIVDLLPYNQELLEKNGKKESIPREDKKAALEKVRQMLICRYPGDSEASDKYPPRTKFGRMIPDGLKSGQSMQTLIGDIVTETPIMANIAKHDRGEISVADCIWDLRMATDDFNIGTERSIFSLFEGGDVRGRVIQRLVNRTTIESNETKGEAYQGFALTLLEKIKQMPRDLQESYGIDAALLQAQGAEEITKRLQTKFSEYFQLGKVLPIFDPNAKEFALDLIKAIFKKEVDDKGYDPGMKTISFLSTKAFFFSLMRLAHGLADETLSPSVAGVQSQSSPNTQMTDVTAESGVSNNQPFIVSPKEASHLQDAYLSVLGNINEKGLPRSYNKFHDLRLVDIFVPDKKKPPPSIRDWEKASQSAYEYTIEEQQFFRQGNMPEQSDESDIRKPRPKVKLDDSIVLPWVNHLDEVWKQSQDLQDILRNWSLSRRESLQEDTRTRWEEISKRIIKLDPETAQGLIKIIVGGISRIVGVEQLKQIIGMAV